MRRLSLLLAFLGVLSLAGRPGTAAPKNGGWIPLFNGKDLSGWYTYFQARDKDGRVKSVARGRGEYVTPGEKNGKVDDLVRVEKNVIHFYPQGGHAEMPVGYLATQKAYSFYHLRFEYKWGTKSNRLLITRAYPASGLYIHAVGKDHSLGPRGIECDLTTGRTGDLVTHSTRVTTTVDPRRKELHYLAPERGGVSHTEGEQRSIGHVYQGADTEKDGWNRVEVIVKGGSIVLMINGKVVNRCTDIRQPDADGRWVPLTGGRILLQAKQAEILFRNVEIRPVWGGPLEVPVVATTPPPSRPFVPAKIEAPEGFTVELAAGPPLVRHPMMICPDDRGRLFVAESAGLNLEARDLEVVRPNSIRLLTDSKGDGKYDRAVTFADRLTFPMGVAWKDGALYVASPPYVWRFRDSKGSGKADERTPLVGRFNDSGIGDSLHGTVFGPDGRLYWVHGIGGGGHEVRDRQGRLVVKSRAPGIFSSWPDGSDIRKHCAGGMNNPVELDFTAAGQAVGTVNLLWGNPRNDALVQWMWGGAYTNNEHLIQDVKRTGDLLGPTYSFGHAAVSGLTRLRSAALGYRDDFLVTQFNTQGVMRVKLTPSGSTYTGEGTVFLRSPNRDVHFTDVLEDADGSLLVVDTGGWFRNGCPESQIAKPDVPGAIYRIRRKGQPQVEDPRGRNIRWEKAGAAELLRLLNDDRFRVRDRAADELARRGQDAVSPLEKLLADGGAPRRARLNAVWALCRMHNAAARAASRKALADRDATVREAAAHAVFCHYDRGALDALLPLLREPSPSVRREAATALGVLRSAKAVPALLAALAGDNDRLLEHALVYALIETDDRAAVLAGLSDPSPRVRRGALIALDQMDHGRLTSAQVLALLGSGDLALERTALQVVSRHPGWAGDIGGLLGKWLAEREPNAERRRALRRLLGAFRGDARVQQLMADTLSRHETPKATRLLLLEVMAAGEVRPWPEAWRVPVKFALNSKDDEVSARGLAAAAASGRAEFRQRFESLAASPFRSRETRRAAAAALAATGAPLTADAFRLLVDQVRDKGAPVERLAAARALAGARLSAGQRRRVAGLLATADPLLLPVLADALEQGGDARTGRAVVAALAKAPGLGNLSAGRLERLLAKYPAEVRRAAEPLVKKLGAKDQAQRERLDELKKLVLTGGDPRKGRQVFHGPRALCMTCHRVGNEGESIGPDLSRIGATRTRADLLEAIVLPSASFARGFEPYVVTTTRGKVYQGIIARQTGEAVYLRTADRAEVRLPRSEIEELAPGKESIMPQGLDRVLTVEELRDLLAFLASLGQ